jgi:arginyl-tRNA synthetase
LLAKAGELTAASLAEPSPGDTPPIVLDYGGANVAKPLHIGHLRPAIIGEAIKRLARRMGHRVIGDVHMGDWGLQIGLVIAELTVRYPDCGCFGEGEEAATGTIPPIDTAILNEVYPFASQKSKTDADFREKARKATLDLQNGRPGYMALWREIMRVSVADLKTNYNRMGVDFDIWKGESDANPYVEELMSILREKELLRESDGALVVDVAKEDDKEPIPPVIVKKSDSSDLYATTDLATIIQRQRDFAPAAIWYITDARQSLHFNQVFRAARLAGLVPEETELAFLPNGTMNGEDNKPYKTRNGGVMRLGDLLDAIHAAAMEKLQASDYIQSLSDTEKHNVAEKVAMAAIKFGDLINYRQKDYIFNMEKFLSFEGKTGPYILYMLTRIHSILKRVGLAYDTELPLTGIYSPAETELLLKLLATGDNLAYAFGERAPNHVCESAYQIAAQFSKFYHENRIVDEPNEENRRSWIALLLLVRRVLLAHLEILGIDMVENM